MHRLCTREGSRAWPLTRDDLLGGDLPLPVQLGEECRWALASLASLLTDSLCHLCRENRCGSPAIAHTGPSHSCLCPTDSFQTAARAASRWSGPCLLMGTAWSSQPPGPRRSSSRAGACTAASIPLLPSRTQFLPPPVTATCGHPGAFEALACGDCSSPLGAPSAGGHAHSTDSRTHQLQWHPSHLVSKPRMGSRDAASLSAPARPSTLASSLCAALPPACLPGRAVLTPSSVVSCQMPPSLLREDFPDHAV